jgi:small subunit ribosomal protein S4
MKRKHKIYSKPKKAFDKQRIEEEAKIMKEFGLKNKREIWKAEARIKKIREKAKGLISAGPERQEVLFNSLRKMGFSVNSIGDVLALEGKDYLKRRLQTILVTKKFTTTPKIARQLIVHKKILINEKTVNSPSYIVPVELEKSISIKEAKKKKEIKNEIPGENVNG